MAGLVHGTHRAPLPAGDLTACCSPLAGVLDEDTAERLARIFRALGDRHRVRLLSMIAAADGRQACISDLTAPSACPSRPSPIT